VFIILSKTTRRELLNFFRKFLNPLFFFKASPYVFLEISKLICRKLLHKMYFTNFMLRYPSYLGNFRKQYIPEKKRIVQNIQIIKVPLKILSISKVLPEEIPLATRNLKVIGSKIPWNSQFEDIEDLFSLHRWGWLLRLSVKYPTVKLGKWGAQVVEDWINNFAKNKKGPIWESYSVSDRIVNGILFICIYNEYIEASVVEKISKFISEMAYFLVTHLEYHGLKRTNNHILNNARALYIAGIYLKDPLLSKTGKKIWLSELPSMLTKYGFLREESSHYHFLLTRSVLETWWFAKESNDIPFAKKLGKFAIKMIKNCYFFLVKNNFTKEWEMPFIGDVSPDFPPDWLITVPISSIAVTLMKEEGALGEHNVNIEEDNKSSWASLWGEKLFNYPLFFPDNKKFQKKFYPIDGWNRLDFKKITIFWYIKPKGRPYLAYHGHNDIGSFCLYYDGNPVIIDPGRYSYQKTPFAQYGKMAISHNTFLIDSFEQFPLNWYGILPPWYACEPVETFYKEKKDIFKFGIRHKGLYRIKGIENVSRVFYLDEDGLTIEDSFKGEDIHQVFSLFHLAPWFNVTKISHNKCSIKVCEDFEGLPDFTLQGDADDSNTKISLEVYKGNNNLPLGWYFSQYGSKIKAPSVAFAFSERFPLKLYYKFKWR